MTRDDIPEPTDVQKTRMRIAREAMGHVARAARDGDADPEATEAAFNQFVQTADAFREAIDCLHVPDDAGEHRDGLVRILSRIPEGWGRWIGCSAGWYGLICELDSALAQLDPDYAVHQCKEKFGGLRYYAHSTNFRGGGDNEFRRLISTAEERSTRTCELCGEPGRLHARRSWVKTVCSSCAAAAGWELIGETVDELTPDRDGVWAVTTADGAQHVLDLWSGRYSAGGGVCRVIAAVDLWPEVGGDFRVVVEAGDGGGDEWRVGEGVTRIERIR